MGTRVDLNFLNERKAQLQKRINDEKARDAQQTVAALEVELEITNLAIAGLTNNR
jgi:hypothetical protein